MGIASSLSANNSTLGKVVISIGDSVIELPQGLGKKTGIQQPPPRDDNTHLVKATILDERDRPIKTTSFFVPVSHYFEINFGNDKINYKTQTGGETHPWHQDLTDFYKKQDEIDAHKQFEADQEEKRRKKEEDRERLLQEAEEARRAEEDSKRAKEKEERKKALKTARALGLLRRTSASNSKFTFPFLRLIEAMGKYGEEPQVLKEIIRVLTSRISGGMEFGRQEVEQLSNQLNSCWLTIKEFCFPELLQLLEVIITHLHSTNTVGGEMGPLISNYIEATIQNDLSLLLHLPHLSSLPIPDSWASKAKAVLKDISTPFQQRLIAFQILSHCSSKSICNVDCFKPISTTILESLDSQIPFPKLPNFVGVFQEISQDHLLCEDMYQMLESFVLYLVTLDSNNNDPSQLLSMTEQLLSPGSKLNLERTRELRWAVLKHTVSHYEVAEWIPRISEIMVTYLQETDNNCVDKILEIVFQIAIRDHTMISEELKSLMTEKEDLYKGCCHFRWALEILKEQEDLRNGELGRWTSEWAREDPTGLLSFLRERKVDISNNQLKVQCYLALATTHNEMLDYQGSLDLVDECLSSVLCFNTETKDFREQTKYPELLQDALTFKGLAFYKSRKFDKAQEIFGIIEGEKSKLILEEIRQFPDLLTLEFLETEAQEDLPTRLLKEIHEMLLAQNPSVSGKEHIRLILEKLGPLTMGKEGTEILQFLKDLGVNYRPEVILEHDPQNWMTQSLHSFIQGYAPNGSQEMWDSLIAYHESGVKDNKAFCESFFQFSSHFEQELIEKFDFVCFLFHIPVIPEGGPFTLDILQERWVQQFFPEEEEGERIHFHTFWAQIKSLGFLSNTENMFLLHEICTLFKKSGETLQEFISLSETASKLGSSPPILSSMIQKCVSTRGSFSATYMKEQNELGFVETAINQIFKINLLGEEETELVKDNCKLLSRTLLKRWQFSRVQVILEIFKKSIMETESFQTIRKMMSAFSQLLNVLASYDFSEDDHEEILEIIQSHSPEEVLAHLKPFCVKAISPVANLGGRERDTLFSLLEETNSSNSEYLLELNEMRGILDSIPDCEDSPYEIACWIKTGDFEELAITLGKLVRGVELFMGFKPRDTQLVSLLSMILSYEKGGKGRLAKIRTGEGKSVIVAMLATYLAIKGNKVDVITCSTILAERDAAEFKKFYSMFSLSSGNASGNQVAKGVPKPCYNYNILYGDPSTIQADILRDEFSLLNTRGGRKFDVVIVDEVDSMLIDQGGHSTRLVDKMPGMDQLEVIYLLIWTYLEDVQNFLVNIYGELYFVQDVKGADAKSLLSVLATVTKRFGSEALLHKALQEFASKCKEEELHQDGGREAIRILMENGAIGDYDPARELTEADVEKEINNRWDLSTQSSIRRIAEIFFGKEILILEMDEEQGFTPSKVFHSFQSKNPPLKKKLEKLAFLQMETGLLQLHFVSNRKEFLKTKVTSKVNDMIEFANNGTVANNSKKFILPPHLKEIYEAKLGKWIESAVTARFHVAEKRDYLLKQNEDGEMKVVPVDYESTGVIQDGTVWSDGLHQFLQIRHNLALSPEHLATNFLSNLIFFRRYGNKIYGLTGTIGSVPERDLLSSVYFVEAIEIPTFKEKQHHSLTDIPALSSQHWLDSITTSVLSHIHLGRGILIVCKSIRDVNTIEDYLKKSLWNRGEESREFDRYTRTDLDSEVAMISKTMLPGGVIIATNLAGRGTDIKLDDALVSNGGLHVCITFLPANLRVEEQALGRASRKGQPGSSQLIFNLEVDGLFTNLVNPLDPIEIKLRRDLEEENRIEQIKSETIPTLEKEEVDFRHYLTVRNNIREYLGEDLVMSKYGVASADEHWGMLLDTSKCRNLKEIGGKIEDIRGLFTQTGNPHYNILMGNSYNSRAEYDYAVPSFDAAIALDPTFSAFAHYYKTFSIVCQDGKKIKEAGEEFVKAANLIYQVNIPVLVACQQLGSSTGKERNVGEDLGNLGEGQIIQTKDKDSPFTKQIVNKISVLQALVKSVEEGLKVLEKEKVVLAEMMGIEDYFKDKELTPPQSEISALRESGLIGFIKIKKKPPPWYVFFVVIMYGILEVALGTCFAILTAGAFGTGMIVDGVTDCVSGIAAAINGEHICLSSFFQQKAISLTISVVAASAGAALSAAANSISSFVTNMSTKFFETGIGSALKTFGEKVITFAKEIWSITKTMAENALNTTKDFFKTAFEKTAKFLGNLSTTLKLDKAWAFLQTQWNKAELWVTNKLQSFSSNPTVSNMMDPFKTEQVKLATKLVAKEVGKVLVMEGIDWVLEEAVLAPVTDGIKSSLSSKVRDDCGQRLNQNPLVHNYFSQAGSKEEFDALMRTFTTSVLAIIHRDFGLRGSSEGVQYLFQGISAISAEVKRIFGENKNKHVFAKVLQITATAVLESAKFGILVDQLRKYVPQVFQRLEKEFKEEDGKEAASPYIESEQGQKDFEGGKVLIAREMGESIGEYMAGMIAGGVVKTKFDLGVGWMVDRIKPLNKMESLTKYAESQASKHPNIRPNASIWDLVKKEEPITAPPAKLSKEKSTLHLLSQATKRPIEIYKVNPHGKIELDKGASIGKIGKASSAEPIRLLSSEVERKSNSDSGIHYDPILPSGNGGLVVSKSSEVGLGIDKNFTSLLAATFSQSESGGISNVIYKMRMKENADKFRSVKSF